MSLLLQFRKCDIHTFFFIVRTAGKRNHAHHCRYNQAPAYVFQI
ncbi:hypothetical protein FMM78_15150 [Bacteroides caecimuris]|nr:hypothetical protein [Bacteroides caecimuris]